MFVFVRSLLYVGVCAAGRAGFINSSPIDQSSRRRIDTRLFLLNGAWLLSAARNVAGKRPAQHRALDTLDDELLGWHALGSPAEKARACDCPRAGTTIPPHRPHIGASCRTTRHFLLLFRVTVRPPRGGLSSRGSITALTPPLPAHKHRDPHLSPRVSPRSLDHLHPFVDFEVSLLT